MYIIIKKDKADDLYEKLHKVKKFACEVLEELEYAREKVYDMEEFHSRERSRHSGHHELDREYNRDYDYRDEREMARGGGGYGGRGRNRY